MSLITRFEDIQAWQEARKLVKMIYQLTGSGTLAKDFGLRDQMQRAAVEVQSLLYAAFDCLYIDETQLKEYYEQARKTKALIGAFKHLLKK